MVKNIICDLCNIKCILKITEVNTDIRIEGNKCEKGVAVSYESLNSKKDILVTLVRIKGGKSSILPVKTKEPVDKSLFLEISKALSRVYVSVPIQMGDVICKNILNTGVDIISGKNVLE